MKSISDALYAHISAEVTTLCTVWRMTRRDGVVMGFTDHDRNIVIDGVTYHAETGFTPTAIDKSVDFSVDNLDVEGQLEDDRITEADIWSGIYDYAKIDVVQVDYTAPPARFQPGDCLWHTTGYLGEVRSDGNRFKVEVRSLTQMLVASHGKLTQKVCPHNLGDASCQVNAASMRLTGTVERVLGDRTFGSAVLNDKVGFYSGGLIRFLTGEGVAGARFEVAIHSQGLIRLYTSPYEGIPVGATYEVFPGCDKSISTCRSKFNNVKNFGGFPHVPGTDAWMSGKNEGLIDIMETLKDQQERENGPATENENTETWDTPPIPTGE